MVIMDWPGVGLTVSAMEHGRLSRLGHGALIHFVITRSNSCSGAVIWPPCAAAWQKTRGPGVGANEACYVLFKSLHPADDDAWCCLGDACVAQGIMIRQPPAEACMLS